MAIESYKDLRVWQEGMILAEKAYLHTRAFPKSEMFGLTSQIRRATASIPANIAEGWGRESTGDYIRFLLIAQGSLKEFETHLMLSQRVGLSEAQSAAEMLSIADGLGRMLRGLIRSLQNGGA